MFVHNSGAGNAIHLFASWRGVLQNIDERQSVEEACERVRRTRTEWSLGTNEVEIVASRLTARRGERVKGGGKE